MTWTVVFMEQATEDLKSLDHSQRVQALKAIMKVSTNPLPDSEGGYGKPLGNLRSGKLSGCCKIKMLKLGLRVVYKLVREAGEMKIIVVAARSDDAVYREAERRIQAGTDKKN